MIYTTVNLLISVFDKSRITYNKSVEKLTLTKETRIHNVTGKNGVKFAISWIDSDGQYMSTTVGYPVVYQRYGSNVNFYSDLSQEPKLIPLKICTLTEFSNGIIEFSDGSENYNYWPEDDFDFSLQSDKNGLEYREIIISFERCRNLTDFSWKSIDQINSKIDGSFAQITTMTPYFDF